MQEKSTSQIVLEIYNLLNALWISNVVRAEESMTSTQCIDGVKGHERVKWGQPDVKLLISTLWLLTRVRRSPDQSVMHYVVKGHVWIVQGQQEML